MSNYIYMLASENALFSEPSILPSRPAGTTTLVPYTDNGTPSPELISLAQTAQSLLDYQLAPSTQSVYERDWKLFVTWCIGHGLPSLPTTETILVLYATAQAERGLKIPTIRRRLAAIRTVHSTAGYQALAQSTLVRDILRGISRRDGMLSVGVKALLTDDIRLIVQAIHDDTLIGRRNRAIILLGYAGAFRRSELVGLDMDDLQDDANGLIVRLKKSKTDQQGLGRFVGIPKGTHQATCPVQAIRQWLESSGFADGPLFRSISRHGIIAQSRLSDRSVAMIIKRCAADAGLDPTHYAGHSLRAGHCTQACREGVAENIIRKQTGHRSRSTLQRYIRVGTLFADNSADALGL